jgi:hypothetical protein
MAFARNKPMKSLSITTSEHFLNLTSPTDSSEEAFWKHIVAVLTIARCRHVFAQQLRHRCRKQPSPNAPEQATSS